MTRGRDGQNWTTPLRRTWRWRRCGMQSSGPSSTSSTSTTMCIRTLMKWCTTGRWKQKSSEGVAWDPSDATRWKETWSHHNRHTTWDTNFARWFVDRKGCVEKLKDSLPEEVSASRLLQRIGMLVAHIKSEMKRAHVAHTQLRNSDLVTRRSD